MANKNDDVEISLGLNIDGLKNEASQVVSILKNLVTSINKIFSNVGNFGISNSGIASISPEKEIKEIQSFIKKANNRLNTSYGKFNWRTGDYDGGTYFSKKMSKDKLAKNMHPLIKNRNSNLNPTYGVFDEESGEYRGGEYLDNKYKRMSLKKAYGRLNPSYGFFDEETGFYKGGNYFPEKLSIDKLARIMKPRMKNVSDALNPSYGIFDEESGEYKGGKFFNDKPQKAILKQNAVLLKAMDRFNANTLKYDGGIYTLNKQFKEIETTSGKIGNSLTELKIVGVYAFRMLSKATSGLLKTMSKAGSELYELNSRFKIIMKDMTKDAENFANELGSAYGLNEATIKTNMLRLYTLAQNSGLANEQALKLTKTMSRLGIEISSVWDIPVEQATDNLISALQGLPRAMKKYGSYLGSKEVKEFFNEYRSSKGLEPITRELTRQEKTIGAYLKSLSDLGYSFGDFERTVTSTANQSRIFQETLKTLMQTGGLLINEVVSPILQIGNMFLKTVSAFTKTLTKMPKPIRVLIGALMTLVLITPIIFGSATLFIYYTLKIKETLKSMNTHLGESSKRMLSFGKATMTTAKWVGKFLLLAMSIYAFIDTFKGAKDTSDEFNDSLNNQINTVKSLKRELSSYDDVNVFKEKESDSEDSLLAGGDLNSFLDSIGLANDEITRMNDLFGETNTAVRILSVSFAVLDILSIINQFKSLKGAFVALFSFIKTNAAPLTLILVGVGGTVKVLVDLFKQWSDMNTAQKIVSIITAIASATLLLAAAIAAVKQNYIKAGILATAAGGVALAGSSISALSSGKNIPKMAHGGVVSNSTIAQIGEGKYNEAVVPLGNSPEFSQMKSDITNAVLAGMSQVGSVGRNQPINITINVDEDYIYRAYNKVAKQNGDM